MNEIAVNVMHNIMTPADFSQIDQIITRLGERDIQLSDKEKDAAIGIVNDWQEFIEQRIRENQNKARCITAFLNGNGQISEEILDMFEEITGPDEDLAAYRDVKIEIEKHALSKPIEPVITPDMTIIEAEKAKSGYHLEQAIMQQEYNALINKGLKHIRAYVVKLNRRPDINDMKKKMRDYNLRADNHIAVTRAKAAEAKINISIESENLKENLHSLMDFAKSV